MKKRRNSKRKKRRSRSKSWDSFPIINVNAAGIDIGSEEHWVAVPADRDEEPVRSFGCFTGDLHAMAERPAALKPLPWSPRGSIGSLHFRS
jgi:hypothetical protein